MRTVTIELENKNVILTAYIQDSSPKEMPNTTIRPGILVLPGGGYFMCSDREAEPIALAYMAEGYNAFVLRYSVGQQQDIFEAAFSDAQEAMDCIQANAEDWCVDKEKIAVIGFSAGGHLAASLGTMGRIRPAAMLLGYPVILGHMGTAINKALPSLEQRVDDKTPPCFIFSTQADRTVPIENSVSFAAALVQANVPFEMHIFQEGGHGLSLGKSITCSTGGNSAFTSWFAMSIEWLKLWLGDFGVNSTLGVQVAGKKTNNTVDDFFEIPIRELIKEDSKVEVINGLVPGLIPMVEANTLALNLSFSRLAEHAPQLLSKEILEELKSKLEI